MGRINTPRYIKLHHWHKTTFKYAPYDTPKSNDIYPRRLPVIWQSQYSFGFFVEK